MGFIPGSEILMVRTAPLMDPIEVMVQNYFVTIRKEEAGIIEVELI
ncbi:MAG: ferrous iron transport protein A [Geovibrio sp.]|nr:ferrous iron transport protein A [Geovibrio sp.]